MRVCKYEHGKVYELMRLLCNLCYKYDDTFLGCMDVCNVCVCVCVVLSDYCYWYLRLYLIYLFSLSNTSVSSCAQ